MIRIIYYLYLIYLLGITKAYFTLQLDTIKVNGQQEIYFFVRNITSQILRNQVEAEEIKQDNTLIENIEQNQTNVTFQNPEGLTNNTDKPLNQTLFSQESEEDRNIVQEIENTEVDQVEQESNNTIEENVTEVTAIESNKIQTASDPISQTIFKESDDTETVVSLDNYYNYQYIGQVNVLESMGSIKQYRVIFDSGSSWVWLPKNDCNGCPSNKDTGLICQQQSSYCQFSSESMNVTYSMGAINGLIASGYFAFNQNIDDFKRVKFLLVENAWGMEGALYQGIIGLELDNKEDNLINWPVGFYLSHGDDSSTREKSQINFGGINLNLIKPNEVMLYVPVSQHWLIDVQKFEIVYTTIHSMLEYSISTPNRSISYDSQWNDPLNSTQQLKVVIDSGSSLLMLPKQYLEGLYQTFLDHNIDCQRPEISHTSLKCSCPTQNKDLFPTLSITFTNGVQISLEPQYYIHTTVDSHICYVLISPIPMHEDNMVILGNPFMRKYYTLFDKENRQIGLAQSINTIKRNQLLNITSLFSYVFLVSCSFTMSYLVIALLNHAMSTYLKKKETEIGKVPQQQRMNYRLV